MKYNKVSLVSQQSGAFQSMLLVEKLRSPKSIEQQLMPELHLSAEKPGAHPASHCCDLEHLGGS